MKILLATDGSEYSFEAARKCCEMIRVSSEATIKIICIAEKIGASKLFEDSDDYLAIARMAALEAAENIVEDTRMEIRAALGSEDTIIETKAIPGNEKEAILEEADEWEADLIVVGSHGHGFFTRMLLGSVSNAVVRHAKCSVLVVRSTVSDLKEYGNGVREK